MPDKPVTPLRQQMIEDMTANRFLEDTQRRSCTVGYAVASDYGRS